VIVRIVQPACCTSSGRIHFNFDILFFQTKRIDRVEGIVANIGVQIQSRAVTNPIGLKEAPDARVVDAGLVVVEPRLG